MAAKERSSCPKRQAASSWKCEPSCSQMLTLCPVADSHSAHRLARCPIQRCRRHRLQAAAMPCVMPAEADAGFIVHVAAAAELTEKQRTQKPLPYLDACTCLLSARHAVCQSSTRQLFTRWTPAARDWPKGCRSPDKLVGPMKQAPEPSLALATCTLAGQPSAAQLVCLASSLMSACFRLCHSKDERKARHTGYGLHLLTSANLQSRCCMHQADLEARACHMSKLRETMPAGQPSAAQLAWSSSCLTCASSLLHVCHGHSQAPSKAG